MKKFIKISKRKITFFLFLQFSLTCFSQNYQKGVIDKLYDTKTGTIITSNFISYNFEDSHLEEKGLRINDSIIFYTAFVNQKILVTGIQSLDSYLKYESIDGSDIIKYKWNKKPKLIWTAGENENTKGTPAIFYSPHQDDETLGMGASISENSRICRPTYVVLMTNGKNSSMLEYLQDINPSYSENDVTTFRNNEFIAACISLRVDRIYIANVGEGYDETNLSQSELEAEFKSTMWYMEILFPGSSHKTVSGNCDVFADENSICETHPSHAACTNSIKQLYYNNIITDIRLYRVYAYYRIFDNIDLNFYPSNCSRPPDWYKPVFSTDKLFRKFAIEQYKYVDQSIGRFGLGYYHSVYDLFNNSYDSDFELIDFIDQDCN